MIFYLATVSKHESGKMELEVDFVEHPNKDSINPYPILKVRFSDVDFSGSSVAVNATIKGKADILGGAVEGDLERIIFIYNEATNTYEYDTKGMDFGIYNLELNAVSGNFERDIKTIVSVGTLFRFKTPEHTPIIEIAGKFHLSELQSTVSVYEPSMKLYEEEEDYNIQVINFSGISVANLKVEKKKYQRAYNIESDILNNLPSGIYFIISTSGSERENFKVLKK